MAKEKQKTTPEGRARTATLQYLANERKELADLSAQELEAKAKEFKVETTAGRQWKGSAKMGTGGWVPPPRDKEDIIADIQQLV